MRSQRKTKQEKNMRRKKERVRANELNVTDERVRSKQFIALWDHLNQTITVNKIRIGIEIGFGIEINVIEDRQQQQQKNTKQT